MSKGFPEQPLGVVVLASALNQRAQVEKQEESFPSRNKKKRIRASNTVNSR
jgi:hypothetical protein